MRPWAEGPRDADTISGTAGLLWHSHWTLGEEADPVEAWRTLGREVRELVTHMIFDGVLVEATFAAIDDEKAIANAIGQIFDRLIPASQSLRPKPDDFEELWAARRAAGDQLPPKAQVGGVLARLDPYNPEAFSIFGA